MMREAEMDALAMPWANVRAAHLLAVQRMTPVEVGNVQEEGYDMDEDNPLMYTQKAETLEPFFLSCNTHEDNEGISGRVY